MKKHMATVVGVLSQKHTFNKKQHVVNKNEETYHGETTNIGMKNTHVLSRHEPVRPLRCPVMKPAGFF